MIPSEKLALVFRSKEPWNRELSLPSLNMILGRVATWKNTSSKESLDVLQTWPQGIDKANPLNDRSQGLLLFCKHRQKVTWIISTCSPKAMFVVGFTCAFQYLSMMYPTRQRFTYGSSVRMQISGHRNNIRTYSKERNRSCIPSYDMGSSRLNMYSEREASKGYDEG